MEISKEEQYTVLNDIRNLVAIRQKPENQNDDMKKCEYTLEKKIEMNDKNE